MANSIRWWLASSSMFADWSFGYSFYLIFLFFTPLAIGNFLKFSLGVEYMYVWAAYFSCRPCIFLFVYICFKAIIMVLWLFFGRYCFATGKRTGWLLFISPCAEWYPCTHLWHKTNSLTFAFHPYWVQVLKILNNKI